jgi:hypothetical protein
VLKIFSCVRISDSHSNEDLLPFSINRRGTGQFWSMDTDLECWTGPHRCWLLAHGMFLAALSIPYFVPRRASFRPDSPKLLHMLCFVRTNRVQHNQLCRLHCMSHLLVVARLQQICGHPLHTAPRNLSSGGIVGGCWNFW